MQKEQNSLGTMFTGANAPANANGPMRAVKTMQALLTCEALGRPIYNFILNNNAGTQLLFCGSKYLQKQFDLVSISSRHPQIDAPSPFDRLPRVKHIIHFQ